MNPLLRLWSVLRQSGWFVPSATGGLFPFPQSWQAWAMTAAFMIALVATVFLPADAGWMCRIGLCIGYVGLAMLTYE